jgi:hypothetical protein
MRYSLEGLLSDAKEKGAKGLIQLIMVGFFPVLIEVGDTVKNGNSHADQDLFFTCFPLLI